jgi:hypothetical protein
MCHYDRSSKIIRMDIKKDIKMEIKMDTKVDINKETTVDIYFNDDVTPTTTT